MQNQPQTSLRRPINPTELGEHPVKASEDGLYNQSHGSETSSGGSEHLHRETRGHPEGSPHDNSKTSKGPHHYRVQRDRLPAMPTMWSEQGQNPKYTTQERRPHDVYSPQNWPCDTLTEDSTAYWGSLQYQDHHNQAAQYHSEQAIGSADRYFNSSEKWPQYASVHGGFDQFKGVHGHDANGMEAVMAIDNGYPKGSL